MKLAYLGEPDSGKTGSPRAFATDRGTYVVQGWKVTDEDALAELRKRGLPDHETAIEIPAGLLQYLPADRA
ncbi:MAG TPA: hypothetical protein VHX38_09635 [Pseudonocardiaceae bacterium]|jgi:hypothetical protein|nr:hypothetical protein [Pseudonocardiaceae bacterium]